MKKKFLSLMMAAAVVATTSVSAFAKEYNVMEGTGKDAEVQITGNIADRNDAVLPSTISVTVPTTATFTVSKDGVLTAPDINITSVGEGTVEVIAHSFVDTTADKITVLKESDINDQSERTNVSLKLSGNNKTVALKSEAGSKNGIYKEDGTEAAEDNTVLGTVTQDKPLNLRLTGTAGKKDQPLAKAVNDNFTLILKLKKSR